jgi:hypothetical protein
MIYVFLKEKPNSQSGILNLIIERIGGNLFTVYSQLKIAISKGEVLKLRELS